MTKKTKLELTWIGHDEAPQPEPRILLEDSTWSHHAKSRTGQSDQFENAVILADNLLALKALESELTGQVKCIYIDPPYNARAATPDYDDNLEHSLWLSMMRDRLVILWRLLTKQNGVLLISINDDEGHYLKVLCDQLFGRDKFVASLVWNYEGNTDNQAKIINYHEYILVYSTTGEVDPPGVFDPSIPENSKLFRPEIRNTVVKNGPKNPPKPVLLPRGFPAAFNNGIIRASAVTYPRYAEDLVVEDGKLSSPVVATSGWSARELLEDFIASGFRAVVDTKGQQTVFELRPSGAIEAVKKRIQEKGHFTSVLRGLGTTNQMRILLEKIGVKFAYPKPVNLIAHLVAAFSGPNDLVLDSFAGSGTTGHAVLQLNRTTGSSRRFILVEQVPETMFRVTIPRLRAVVDGSPKADLPPCGGGFRFLRLAPSMLEKDKYGRWVVSKQYNPVMLAEAMCKHEGFKFAPSDVVYWQQGQSTERDFIYVTTQTLAREQLAQLSEEVGPDRSLLVCCAAFRANPDEFPNLTLKKIPHAVLHRCEWGRDDYSLAVSELPEAPAADTSDDVSVQATPAAKRRGRKVASDEPELFEEVES